MSFEASQYIISPLGSHSIGVSPTTKNPLDMDMFPLLIVIVFAIDRVV